jgi:CheY-like chemotaxis protein
MSKPTVIIADDSKTFRMYFSTLLSRMNFEVMPVPNGQEAIDLARVISPHMIALDVRMAGLDGIETLQQLRSDTKLSNTPVVMISADASHAEECFATGCNDFLTKPIDVQNLHIALQKCQQNHQGLRKHLRTPFTGKVNYYLAGKQMNARAVTLSEGGIFLHTTKPLPVSSRLEIDLPLSKKESMLLCGEVIYTMDSSRGKFYLPSGMAIRFDDCPDDIQKRLSQEVKNLLAGDLIETQGQSWFCTN